MSSEQQGLLQAWMNNGWGLLFIISDERKSDDEWTVLVTCGRIKLMVMWPWSRRCELTCSSSITSAWLCVLYLLCCSTHTLLIYWLDNQHPWLERLVTKVFTNIPVLMLLQQICWTHCKKQWLFLYVCFWNGIRLHQMTKTSIFGSCGGFKCVELGLFFSFEDN